VYGPASSINVTESNAATLTVTAAGPAITSHPANQSVVERGTAAFSVTASNAASYQWRYSANNGANWSNINDSDGFISGATTATLKITGMGIGWNGYIFRCVVTGSGGSADSNTATLTVTAGFIAVTDITGVPAATAASTPLTLTGAVVPDAATNKTITWSVKSEGTTGATITGGNTLNTTAGGTVIVTATVANGQTATTPFTKDFTITVNPVGVPKIIGPAVMTLEEGYTAVSSGVFTISGDPAPTVTKTSGDAKITWNDASKKLDIAAGLAEGVYQVALKAANGNAPDSTFAFTLTVTAEEEPDETPETPVIPITPETPNSFPFTDVPESAWYYYDVKNAYEMGLINGKTETLFAPNDNLTYAEAVKLAACMHQLYTTGSVTLANASPTWYQSYVDYAKANGIINKDYNWGAQATRAGYMEMFANALPDSALAPFNTVPDGSIPDVPMTHPQASAIYKLYRAGILQGVDAARKCNPGSNIRRSEVAAILTRMMDPSERVSFSM